MDMYLSPTFIGAAPGTRPPRQRYFWQYTLTMAAAILVLIFIGGLLIEMVNNPKVGYPAAISLETEEPTAEPTSACDSNTDYVELSRDSIISGDYITASAAAACTIEINPDNLTAYIWRGGLAAAEGNYDQLADDLYALTIRHTSGTSPANTALVQEIPNLKNTIASRPDDFVPNMLRGLIFWSSYLMGSARSDWDRVIELAPDNQVPYLFYYFLDQGRDEDKWTTGLNLSPDSTLPDFLAGFHSGTTEMHYIRFSQIIENNPSHAFAYLFRAANEVWNGDMQGAAQDFYQHIQNNQVSLVDGGALSLGDILHLDNSLPGQVYRLTFTAEQGQVLNLSPVNDAADGLLPNALVVLDPANNVLEVPYTASTSSAPIGFGAFGFQRFEVPETGTYTVLLLDNDRAEITVRFSETSE